MKQLPDFVAFELGYVIVHLPRKFWFCCHTELKEALHAECDAIPGWEEDLGQFEGQSFQIDPEEFTLESERELLEVLRKYKRRSDARERRRVASLALIQVPLGC